MNIFSFLIIMFLDIIILMTIPAPIGAMRICIIGFSVGIAMTLIRENALNCERKKWLNAITQWGEKMKESNLDGN